MKLIDQNFSEGAERMDKREFADRVHAMLERLYRLTAGQLREEQDRKDAVQEIRTSKMS